MLNYLCKKLRVLLQVLESIYAHYERQSMMKIAFFLDVININTVQILYLITYDLLESFRQKSFC